MKIGAAGPFSVFGQTDKTKAFQKKLKDLKIDAVITGNCGCGLCTTKECGNSIAAEYIGIPAVTIGAPTFIAQIHSTEELKKNTREALGPQIKKALTEEITKEEIALYAPEGKRPAEKIIGTIAVAYRE